MNKLEITLSNFILVKLESMIYIYIYIFENPSSDFIT